jgi:hypothetical protein|tara:strand:+ start:98 stop:472 length:375 start_codon:yes stop_codon:yes gene_type:complete
MMFVPINNKGGIGMADQIMCERCNETWEDYGVFNGDMDRWEAVLLLSGAGCPCCEGVVPVVDGMDRYDFIENAVSFSIFNNPDFSGGPLARLEDDDPPVPYVEAEGLKILEKLGSKWRLYRGVM